MDISNEEFKQKAGKLLKYMMGRLKITSPPSTLTLMDNKENAEMDWGYTGDYNPKTKAIRLFTTNRHHIDILRSLAHEVIHHWQNENGQLQDRSGLADDPQYAQKDEHMRKMEKQAYLLGNMIFRDFEDIERHGDVDIVKESTNYFMVGHGPGDYSWIWLNGELKVGKGGHSSNFYPDELQAAKNKGRFEPSSGTVTVLTTKAPASPELMNALKDKFDYKQVLEF